MPRHLQLHSISDRWVVGHCHSVPD